MDKLLHVSATPHIHSGRSTQQIMRDVIIALLPATVAGALIFGPRALLVVAVTTCKARTIYAGCAAKGIDTKTAIVGKGRKIKGGGNRFCLD